jgi:hypothetical protein
MQQLYRLGERRPCQVCRREIVYGALGWLHVRRPKRPHTPVPVAVERQVSEELHFLDREDPPGNLAEALHAYIAANDTVASFQRGWQQVITGQTKSIADLWDDIDAE